MTLKIEYTPLLQKTKDCKAKTIVHVGGSGSSKSYSLEQLMIYKMTNEHNKKFYIARKTMPANKRSAYSLFMELLQEYGLYNERYHNKTDHTYTCNGNVIYFLALDEPTKIKSSDVNYVWLEEATEFTYRDYQTFKLQCRRPNADERNHIYLSLNPIDEHHWIAEKLQYEDDVEVIHSTYKDNPFLARDAVATIEALSKEDENYYRVMGLGLWGKLENVIYQNYNLVDELPNERQAMAYGLDFGYAQETALLKICIGAEREVYLDERIYKTHLTNSDLIELLSHEERGDIYADSAEPQRIEEIYRAGYNIYPANKDVKLGIDLCKRQSLNITKQSINLIKEIQGYRRKTDKNGYVLEEPVKFRDHLMDDMRYGIYGMTERYGFATAKPGARKSKHSMRI